MFFKHKKNLSKYIAGFLLITLVIPMLFFAQPQEAQAIPVTIVGSIPLPIFCVLGLDFNCIKEAALDLIARVVTKVILDTLTNTIIAWIQGGGGENVGFVGNLEQEFRREADIRGGQFLNQLAGVNLCGDIGISLQLTLRTGGGSLNRRLACSVTDIVANVNDFFRDFSRGGWPAFIRISMEPQNNPYGAFWIAVDAKAEAEFGGRKALERNLLQNIGFQGVRTSDKRCQSERLIGPLPPGDKEDIQDNGDGTYSYCYTETRVKTPGHLVADILSKATNNTFDYSDTADEINEALVNIANALISKLITSVTDGIFSPNLRESGDTGGGGGGGNSGFRIVNNTLPVGAINIPYHAQLTAAGGRPPYQWSVTEGNLPNGITLNQNGILAGTASTTGIFGFIIKVTDHVGATAIKQFTLEIKEHIEIGDDENFVCGKNSKRREGEIITLPKGRVNNSYCVGLPYAKKAGSGGGQCDRDSIVLKDGVLPPGIHIAGPQSQTDDSIWNLRGTPTTADSYQFTLQLKKRKRNPDPDATGCIREDGWEQEYALTILNSDGSFKLQIVTDELPDGSVNVPYQKQLSASGGTTPYQWSIASGDLPDGITLNTDGLIAGTASTTGAFLFKVKVIDQADRKDERTLRIKIK